MALLVLGTGCSDFDEEFSNNPNRPNMASGTQLIAQAQLYLPGLSSSPQGEFMAQYLAETQYLGVSLYPQQSTSFYSWYQGALLDLETVLTSPEVAQGKDGPVNNQLAVAKILKAYIYWNITDRWGDVPYSQALQGEENFIPAYDTQQAIYQDLFLELKEAVDMMVPGSITNDIMYDGDMDQWRKFANSIRLLMALRLSEIDPATAQAEFNQAFADGVIESNSDNFVFRHLAEENNQNYWYGQIVNQNREWWALTDGLVQEMKPYDDPRLPVFGNPSRDAGEYVGLVYGDEDSMGTEEFSLLGNAIFAQDAPVYLLTYAQVLFATAEAAERSWVSEDPKTFYDQAIENSIVQWTGTDEGVDDFLVQAGIAFDPSIAMEQIATQRWVHLFMFGYEAWSEWRRTGFPDHFVLPKGVAVPTRLAYPDNEVFLNETNYNDAVQRQFGGDDSIYGQIWWDQ